jgi:hypothetical protein
MGHGPCRIAQHQGREGNKGENPTFVLFEPFDGKNPVHLVLHKNVFGQFHPVLASFTPSSSVLAPRDGLLNTTSEQIVGRTLARGLSRGRSKDQ